MKLEEKCLRSVIDLGYLTSVSQQNVKLILFNILSALKFIHSANVIHRDIKPANILINEECQIKICDFGISRTLPESLLGKGSGNSRRFRESAQKKTEDPDKLKKMIAKKVMV